jgi:hypothetical protein
MRKAAAREDTRLRKVKQGSVWPVLDAVGVQ